MEVREAYCSEDFEWEQCRRVATEGIKDSNVRLLRQYATERFSSGLGLQARPEGGEAGQDWDQSCNI